MSIIRPFEATDIQKFHTVNADPWTATYHNGYYAQYLAQWPDLCYAAQGGFEENVGAYSELLGADITLSPFRSMFRLRSSRGCRRPLSELSESMRDFLSI